jgi:hypothetical protein
MKRLTKNRIDILRCLTEGHHDCGLPPYTVSDIHYMLYSFDENGQYLLSKTDKTREKTQKNQIRRTLEEFAMEGIVVMSRELNDIHNDLLPYWEKKYQIAAMVEANFLEQEIKDIESKVSRANGIEIFGAVFDAGKLTESEMNDLTIRVKRMIQKTHPDKGGKAEHFHTMKKCLDMLRKMPVKK